MQGMKETESMQIKPARFVATATAVCLLSLAVGRLSADAAHPAPVPPAMEIEVLDPGVDPRGNPAVSLEPGPHGQMQVDIPPVVLVYRYYYSGDRSFQVQLLPGGPSIVVANHPKTGQRCYIPVQMMPGVPRVTYTSRTIEYDYGQHGIKIVFSAHSDPIVKYPSGLPWRKRLANFVHAEHFKTQAVKVKNFRHHVAADTKDSFVELFIDTEYALEGLTLPIRNMALLMPFGGAAFDPDRPRVREEKIARYHREKERQRLEREAQREQASLPTVR